MRKDSVYCFCVPKAKVIASSSALFLPSLGLTAEQAIARGK